MENHGTKFSGPNVPKNAPTSAKTEKCAHDGTSKAIALIPALTPSAMSQEARSHQSRKKLSLASWRNVGRAHWLLKPTRETTRAGREIDSLGQSLAASDHPGNHLTCQHLSLLNSNTNLYVPAQHCLFLQSLQAISASCHKPWSESRMNQQVPPLGCIHHHPQWERQQSRKLAMKQC